MIVILDQQEISALFRQHPATKDDGGFQGLLVSLQERIDRATGRINLTVDDLEKIPRYAFDYKNGGWENRLIAIFSRTLGSGLGR
jgi:hypothetical protein